MIRSITGDDLPAMLALNNAHAVEVNALTADTLTSLQTLRVMTGGAERTESEYRALLNQVGFRLKRVVASKSPFSVIEAVPA